jgi:hypothetical protein
MVATDSGGNQFGVSGVMFLSNASGSDRVIANNLKPVGLPFGSANGSAPLQYSCGSAYYTIPGSLQLSNGLVQNNNNLTGEISFPAGLGGFTLSATLAADGQSLTGTYVNMPGCVGIESSGTIAGTQIPSLTGSWPGQMVPCNPSGQGACTPLQGKTVEQMNFTLSQDNATGTVSGSYVGGSLFPDLQAGAIDSGKLGDPPNNYLSGYSMQFHLTDNATGLTGVVAGHLLQISVHSFTGVITLSCLSPTQCPAYSNYLLTIQD